MLQNALEWHHLLLAKKDLKYEDGVHDFRNYVFYTYLKNQFSQGI